ncbi:(2Fe-2S)-binding protein [Rhodobium gokarnense]|uniref:Sarcosine oxidase subunit alpha n=1 Tax=Rhodobium gokarnense TaxID=364296 RepID=A0ABT3H8I0_9HYPH|nr:(2Fe-2S)-binding protein [Rhodobium gokarnense]MCW2306700.1 sarcosine oxidase subunit alpha [Rhodobium gokarnense]
MFRRFDEVAGPIVEIVVDDRRIEARLGENLAAALLAAEVEPFRTTPVSGAGRMPYCMMGVCFDCLAIVDGVPNRQTCLETVRAGMVVERQNGARLPGPQHGGE